MKKMSRLAIKGLRARQRARQRHQSLQNTPVVKNTKVEHLVTHLVYRTIMVCVHDPYLGYFMTSDTTVIDSVFIIVAFL